jgi:hypothetical protein
MHLLSLPHYIIIAFGLLFTLTVQSPVNGQQQEPETPGLIPVGRNTHLLLQPGEIGMVVLQLKPGTSEVNPESTKIVTQFTPENEPAAHAVLQDIQEKLECPSSETFIHLIFNKYGVPKSLGDANSKIYDDLRALIGENHVKPTDVTIIKEIFVLITADSVRIGRVRLSEKPEVEKRVV